MTIYAGFRIVFKVLTFQGHNTDTHRQRYSKFGWITSIWL